MKSFLPRLEIILWQIEDNARLLTQWYGERGISLMGVSKAVLGEPAIAKAMIQGGVKYMADSRLENILKMKAAGLITSFVLLRTALSQAESIVNNTDISLNTELQTLHRLSYFAQKLNKPHQVIIMVELGDLREGIMPCDLSAFMQNIMTLPKIQVVGIGCNLACYGGVKPDGQNMHILTELTNGLEKELSIKLAIISGGNSANYNWVNSSPTIGRVNNLRLGESILLGRETIDRTFIPGLHRQAFQLITEVIESKSKPSLPMGEMGQDAFGVKPVFQDRGTHQRAIIALGRQDVLVSGLTALAPIEILGSSSDHIILDSKGYNLHNGDEVAFTLDYGGLLAAMTSPFIRKRFVPCHSSYHD